MGAAQVLRVGAALEAVSLLLLLGNRATVGSDGLPALVGPLHGLCYVVVIALSFSLLPRRTAWWSVVPGVGGLVAWWLGRRRSGTMTAP